MKTETKKTAPEKDFDMVKTLFKIAITSFSQFFSNNIYNGKFNITESNYAIPSHPMKEKEILLMVKKAQEGKFYSMLLLREKISLWKQQYAH